MRRPRPLVHLLVGMLTTVLAAAGAVSVVPPPMAAAATLPVPAGTTALPTAQINGVVWNQVVAGDKVFAGGSFSKARPAGAAPGQREVTRNNLLAYSLSTGVLNTSFAPSLNGQVNGLALSPDKRTLYVVGSFTKVGSATRNRAAAFDVATGKLLSFAPNLNGPAYAVRPVNSTVYIGGSFTIANGSARTKGAAYTTAGKLTRWAPLVENGFVRQIVVSPDKTRLVLGGDFTSVDHSSNGFGLAMVGLDTGTVLYGMPINKIVRNGKTAKGGIYSLGADSTGFYGTGWGNAPTLEGAFKADWKGNLVWLEDCHGDSYSIYPAGSIAYVASHAHYCGNVGGFGQTWVGIGHRAMAWSNSVAGKISTDPTHYRSWGGTPRPAQLPFYPDLSQGTYTGQSQGPWTVTGSGGYVLYGGEFLTVNDKAQQGLVRFATRAVKKSTDGPIAPSNWTPGIRSYADGTVRVVWTALADRDNSTVSYQVIKNGDLAHPIWSGSASSSFWSLPVVGAFDRGLSSGQTVTYQVRAEDADGNVTTSGVASFTYHGGSSIDTYNQTVLQDNPRSYWQSDAADSGDQPVAATAADLVGTGKPTVDSTVTATPDGPLGGGSTAFHFDGSNKLVAPKSMLAPNTFSIETWFRSTSKTGGSMVIMGNSTTGNSSTYDSTTGDPSNPDRTLYLSPTGQLYFGVWARGPHTISTSQAYNDGAWHQAVATMDPSGMRLFVDGSLVGTLSTTSAGINVVGYWRVGGDTMTGWPGNPTTGYYTGDVDQVAIYSTALTAAQVSQHYQAR